MAVEPSKSRIGIGKLLLNELEKQAQSDGIKQIYSVLLAEDDRDALFLESAGFSPSHIKVYVKHI